MRNAFKAATLALVFGVFTTGGAIAQTCSEQHVISPYERDFLWNAAQGHMLEIQLGKYAIENGESNRVKSFGRVMVLDHTKALDRLMWINGFRRFNLPDTLDMKHTDMWVHLSGMKGAEFDKAYISAMKSDHQEDYNAFEEASRRSWDMDIHSYASMVAPIVKEHLDMINDIDASMNSTM